MKKLSAKPHDKYEQELMASIERDEWESSDEAKLLLDSATTKMLK